MADTDTTSPFPSFFWGNSPNVNQQLRQRMALQMMANKKAYPKNIGEGLSAIGDAIGERGLMKMLEQQDVAAQGVTPPAAPSAAMGPRAEAGSPDVVASAPATRTTNEAAPVGRDAIAATLAGRPSEEAFAYAPTASRGGDVASDAPSVTGVSPKAAVANTAPAPEVPQANPTMSPPAMPSALTAATAGSPPEAQGNRPIVTDIKPQPPAPGAQMAQAQPGYVTPQPSDPTGAPIIPPKPREVQLRQWLATNQGNPYAAMKVAPELEALQTERTTRQNEANELYKAKIAQQTEQVKMREQQLADQAKRIADVAHVQAQTRKENIVENPEEKFMMGPDGVVRPIRVEGEDPNAMPGGKLTEDQRKTLVYHGWAKTGNQAITGNDQMLAHGFQQEMLGKIPFAGNAVQSDAYRRAKNGADNFILAFMRSTSGAQYGATERLDHAKAMLPRYGDDAKTLADKANQRQQFVDSEYAGLGKQGQKMADFLERKHDPVGAERKQQLIDIEMQGIKGAQVGEVKTNRKTGAQRMWNGTRWVETQ